MLFQHKLEVYSRIPTIIQQETIQNNPKGFEKLENLIYQIKPPKEDFYFPS